MNDLDVIREFRADVQEPDVAHLAPLRRQLLNEARPSPKAVRVFSLRRLILPAVSATTAVALGVAALSLASQNPATPPAPKAERQINAANVAAVTLLNRAADNAEEQSAVLPRPDQWIYQKSLVTDHTPGALDFMIFESWWRADGKKMRLVVDGDEKGDSDSEADVFDVDAGEHNPSPVGMADEQASWPNDPLTLLDKLSGNAMDTQAGRERAFEELVEALWTNPLMAPEQLATAYRALALIPGVESEEARDAAGRTGVALTLRRPARTNTPLSSPPEGIVLASPESVDNGEAYGSVILDPRSFQVLGGITRAQGDWTGPSKIRDGQITDLDARLATAIVDSPCERP